jgi:hypothetical protein
MNRVRFSTCLLHTLSTCRSGKTSLTVADIRNGQSQAQAVLDRRHQLGKPPVYIRRSVILCGGGHEKPSNVSCRREADAQTDTRVGTIEVKIRKLDAELGTFKAQMAKMREGPGKVRLNHRTFPTREIRMRLATGTSCERCTEWNALACY